MSDSEVASLESELTEKLHMNQYSLSLAYPHRRTMFDYFVCTETWTTENVFTCPENKNFSLCRPDGDLICHMWLVFCVEDSPLRLQDASIISFAPAHITTFLEKIETLPTAVFSSQTVDIIAVLQKLRECQMSMVRESSVYSKYAKVTGNRQIASTSRSHDLSSKYITNISEKKVFATFLGDESFIPAAYAFIFAFRQQHGNSYTLLICVSSHLSMKSTALQQLQATFPSVQLVQFQSLVGRLGNAVRPRWARNYEKLNLFNMIEYDTICYLDLDTLVQGSLDGIFDHLPLERNFVAAPDWGKWFKPPQPALNGGVLLIRPSQQLFKLMVATLKNTSFKFRVEEAEQGFLRSFFGDSTTLLPFEYNFQKTAIKWSRFDPLRVPVLHFVGCKPHQLHSPQEYLKTYRTRADVIKAIHDDTSDDMDVQYAPLNRKWMKTYLEATRLNESLLILAAFHDEFGFSQLSAYMKGDPVAGSLYVPISLTESIGTHGLATRQVVSELVDPFEQLQFGETAVLRVAFEACYGDKELKHWQRVTSTQWLGITTYNAQRKSMWREGVSLDITKVHEAITLNNTKWVMFWYGIPAVDYWDLMDRHHPGLKQIFERIIPLIWPRTNLGSRMWMPRNKVWPFGSYVILHREALASYGRFEKRFREEFRRLYFDLLVNGKCPFATAETSTHNWEARCVGYALERFLHIWATMEGYSLRYAVDDADLRIKASCSVKKIHCIARP